MTIFFACATLFRLYLGVYRLNNSLSEHDIKSCTKYEFGYNLLFFQLIIIPHCPTFILHHYFVAPSKYKGERRVHLHQILHILIKQKN